MEFTVGADPEFFVQDKKTGEHIPACGLVSGTKENPTSIGDGQFIQVDGTALEVNFAPASTQEEFDEQIRLMKEKLNDFLDPQGLGIVSTVDLYWGKKYNDIPDENKILGCDPDYNALTGKMNPSFTEEQVKDYRCTGGHLHLGIDAEDTTGFRDALLTMAFERSSSYMVKNQRKFYGDYYSYRPKPYGVEFRSPTNSWFFRKASVFQTMQRSLDYLKQNGEDMYRGLLHNG